MTHKLPVLIDFDPSNARLVRGRKVPGVKYGRGRAGYTVVEFSSKAEMIRFMRRHRESAMPSWKRIEGWE